MTARIVRSDNFWNGLDEAINIFEPLVEVLRRVDGDVPAMGFLYGDLKKQKKKLPSDTMKMKASTRMCGK
jgi:hypothetical protein